MEAYVMGIVIKIFLKFVSQAGAAVHWDQIVAEVDQKIRDVVWDPIEGALVAIANGVIDALKSVLSSADTLNALASKCANGKWTDAVTLIEDALKGSTHEHAEAALSGTQAVLEQLAKADAPGVNAPVESTIPDDNGQPAGEQVASIEATNKKRAKKSA